MGSLTALRDKNQRTVYRLTLVAGWNASDAAEYAKLIDLGKPDLIEIKGMTYCGATSGASNLTMKNVPYHDDVKKFGEALCTARINFVAGRDASSDAAEDEPLTGGTPRSAEYGLACEHARVFSLRSCLLRPVARFGMPQIPTPITMGLTVALLISPHRPTFRSIEAKC